MAKDHDEGKAEKTTFVAEIPNSLNYGQVLRLVSDTTKSARTIHGVETWAVIKCGERDGIYFNGTQEGIRHAVAFFEKKAGLYHYGDISLRLKEAPGISRGGLTIGDHNVPPELLEDVQSSLEEAFKLQYSAALESLSARIGVVSTEKDSLDTKVRGLEAENNGLRASLSGAVSLDNITPEAGIDALTRSYARRFLAVAQGYRDVVSGTTIDDVLQSARDPTRIAIEAVRHYARKNDQGEITDEQIIEIVTMAVPQLREDFSLESLEGSRRQTEVAYRTALEGAKTPEARKMIEDAFKPLVDQLSAQIVGIKKQKAENTFLTEASSIYRTAESTQVELRNRLSSSRELLESLRGEEIPIFLQKREGDRHVSRLMVCVPNVGSEEEKSLLMYLADGLRPALLGLGYKDAEDHSFISELKPDNIPRVAGDTLVALHGLQDSLLGKFGMRLSILSKL